MSDDKKQDGEREEKRGSEQEDYKEKFLRMAAEFDNYKKRARKDMESAKSIGKAEAIKGMLPIVDEFDLAMIAISKSQDAVLVKGMELLYSNFTDEMKKLGLKEIPAEGMCDPNVHEIMMVKEDEKRPDGIILEVAKKGYTVDGILLRPASVIVAKKAGKEEKNNDQK